VNLPHTTPEQRLPLYKDVEELITVGFLSHPVVLGGVPLCLRSLGPGDIHMLKFRAVDSSWKLWAISTAIWMVDGVNLLVEPHAVPRLARSIKTLPGRIQDILFSLVFGLYNRVQRAQDGVESFCYETYSRYLWSSFERKAPGVNSGIPGSERLGMNSLQSFWVVHNQAEDSRAKQSRLWEMAKLITSSMAPKGVKKLDDKDRQIRSEEEDQRQRVQDEFFYVTKGLMKRSESGAILGSDGTRVIQKASTPDELAEEMRRWVTGEQDWHDQVVTEYKRQVTERLETQKREREERLAAVRREAARQEQEESLPMPLVGYTVDQLQGLLGGRAAGVRQIGPENDMRQHMYTRYLDAPGPPVPSSITPDGRVVPLGEQIAQRPVPFQTRKEVTDG